jgi:hypothetical protein
VRSTQLPRTSSSGARFHSTFQPIPDGASLASWIDVQGLGARFVYVLRSESDPAPTGSSPALACGPFHLGTIVAWSSDGRPVCCW